MLVFVYVQLSQYILTKFTLLLFWLQFTCSMIAEQAHKRGFPGLLALLHLILLVLGCFWFNILFTTLYLLRLPWNKRQSILISQIVSKQICQCLKSTRYRIQNCDTVLVTGKECLHLIYPFTPQQFYFTFVDL